MHLKGRQCCQMLLAPGSNEEFQLSGARRELSDDALQPVSYTGEGPGGSTYCVNMAAIIRHKRLLVRLCCY